MRHYVATILFALGVAGSLYAAWALHRAGEPVLRREMNWPQPAPYPDGWIAALNGWYDARYPASPGSLKLHGERPRVRLTIKFAIVGCLLLSMVGVRMGAVQRHRGLGRRA